ncbi:MAG: phosphodiester glycosidase family protein [Streptosporangiaceae bacterium]
MQDDGQPPGWQPGGYPQDTWVRQDDAASGGDYPRQDARAGYPRPPTSPGYPRQDTWDRNDQPAGYPQQGTRGRHGRPGAEAGYRQQGTGDRTGQPAGPGYPPGSGPGGPAAPGGPPSRRRPRRERRARRKQIRAARRTIFGRHPFLTVLCAVLVLMTPVWVSLGQALTDPGLGSSLGARGAEWFRGHGFSSVVNWAEDEWYSHHAPPVGGKPAQSTIPQLGSAGGQVRSTIVHLRTPHRMTSPAGHRLPGEGVWHPAGRRVGGIPAVYETWVRPDAVHTSLVIGVAWMDTKLLRATLYSGSTVPGGGPFKHTAPIPHSSAKSLVAAFNSGFLMTDAEGGYYTDGKTILPLRKGAASFVIYKNGSPNIVAWGHGPRATLGPNVVAVRQNLDLLVKNGKPVPGLNPDDTTQWGFTLGNAVYVWRSGIGITRNGALIYVGGPGLNITTLADILARAGAVRAMETDINTDWVNYATYDPHGAHAAATPANGRDLLPDMFGGPDRYFDSWWTRDFITMSARAPQRVTRRVHHR